MINSSNTSLWQDLRSTSYSQGWLDAGGISTRYLQAGDQSLPPLIFLHGAGGHAEAYARNLKAHGRFFNTWSLDMLGHGWSDKPDHPYEISHYVDHILRFMDAQGWDKARLSGESLGGWVVSRIAANHPDRVERVVLNTAGGSRAEPSVMARIKSLSTRAAEEPTWEFIKARVEWLMAHPEKATDDLVACRQAIYSQPGFKQAMANAMVLQDMEVRTRNLITPEDYGRFQSPTLVLWTSHDPTADVTEGRRIADMIPGAQFVVMQDCGHWPQWEDVPTFDRLHINFLLGRPAETPIA
ncbi:MULTISPECIES: alpha/beta fold hydrolase [Polaromonas]|uniref:Alpha/beta fold hydrolase n=1 Tax=Polaromonas aquatica TaxID=332657 RepID=A0ABW1TWL2_9BURK